jgi:hypothetical protein
MHPPRDRGGHGLSESDRQKTSYLPASFSKLLYLGLVRQLCDVRGKPLL